MFAGIVALLNNYLIANGALQVPGLGHINPHLYLMAKNAPSAFHDVSQGNNIIAGNTVVEKRMTDREFIESNWEDWFNPFCGQEWRDFLSEKRERLEKFNGTKDEACSVMAEFTQVEREIDAIGYILDDLYKALTARMEAPAGNFIRPVQAAVERIALMSRVLSRLEAIRDDLKHGMKQAPSGING